MWTVFGFVALGLLAGTFSGLIGIGGAVIIIPALTWFFGMSQHQAQGTTLALMIPPIGLLAAWSYYRAGYVDMKVAALVCVGFFVGGAFGASLATEFADITLRRIFGAALFLISLRMIFGR